MKKILFAIFLLTIAGEAGAAIVYLKEGGSLEGRVVSSNASEIVLETSQGRVSIGLDRVASVDYADGGLAPAPEEAPIEYRVVRRRRPAPEDEALFEPRSQTLSIDFGLDAPLNSVTLNGVPSGSANDGDVGPLVGLQYLYSASRRVALGVDFHYYDRTATWSPGLLPPYDSHVYGDTLLLLGVVKYSLADSGGVRPYVLVGGGMHRTTTTIDSHPLPGYAWPDTGTFETRTLVDDSAVGPAASARLGLDFGFVDPAVLSLEAGWTWLANAAYAATPQGQELGISGVSGPLNYFTFAVRWGWSF